MVECEVHEVEQGCVMSEKEHETGIRWKLTIKLENPDFADDFAFFTTTTPQTDESDKTVRRSCKNGA